MGRSCSSPQLSTTATSPTATSRPARRRTTSPSPADPPPRLVSRSRSRIEIVFLLAGCAARRSELLPRTREFLAHADFDVLARELADRRLLPLIGSRAVEAAPDLVPERFRHAVAAARATARARGLATEAATTAVSAQLAAADIRALPLKGPLLAAEAHGDIGLRETSDIDLLVTRDSLDAAVNVLSSHGFSGPEGIRRANGLPDLHFEMWHPDLPRIDLHWRVHWYESDFSTDMVDRATSGPGGLLRPDPADMLASLLLFHAR